MPSPRRHRSQLSVALLVLQVVAAVLHVTPSLVYPTRPITARIVLYISHLGPVWVLAFGLTSVALAVAYWVARYLDYAHLAAAGVWVMYSSSLWIGALAQSPRGTVLFPCVATALVAVHTIIAASYSDAAGREARR